MKRYALAFALLATTTASESQERAVATFAGGCFWCTEADFEKVPGVLSAVSGYTGGRSANPTYEAVSAGGTGHIEAVRIEYDPAQIGYERLLHIFWRSIDPTVRNRQFCDAGDQYRSAIFVHNAEQRRLAESTKQAVGRRLGTTIHTEIVEAGAFHEAEAYHQDYYKKNPLRYRWYRNGCGRDARLRQLWGDEAGAH